jgi:hypothetical protein
MGAFRLRAPTHRFQLDPKTGSHRTDPVQAALHKPERSRELALSHAVASPHAARAFEVGMLDIPGGWAARDAGQRFAAMRTLLGRTRRYVLFVPCWALLPRPWLQQHALAVLGDNVWATSLGAGPLERADPGLVQQAVDVVATEMRAWMDALGTFAPRGADVFVALSQMQAEWFVPLFDAFADGLGTRTWAAYEHALHGGPVASPLPLHGYVQRIDACGAVGRRFLQELRTAMEKLGSWNEDSVGAGVTGLLRLGDGARPSRTAAHSRLRLRGLLPLNVVAIRGAGKAQWHQHGRGDDLRELRMCQDLLDWLVLDRHASALWPA